jgi:hypothetical protein
LQGRDLEGCAMTEAENFRKWAAQIARQAGEEPDADEARRLLSIAEYWVGLAEVEDFELLRPFSQASH